MELCDSEISCGVYQLRDVGTAPTDWDYQNAMRGCEAAIVVASVPAIWKDAVKFLKRKGFKQATRKIKNPNTDNMIVLLVRNVSAKERANFNRCCRDCDELVPPNRRLCDSCKSRSPRYW